MAASLATARAACRCGKVEIAFLNSHVNVWRAAAFEETALGQDHARAAQRSVTEGSWSSIRSPSCRAVPGVFEARFNNRHFAFEQMTNALLVQ
eukprot:2447133-Amphidinium_carterae.1